MHKTSTPNDVLKKESGELPKQESRNLDDSISKFPELEEFSDAVKQLEKEVPALLLNPSDKPLKNIMAFIEKELKHNKNL